MADFISDIYIQSFKKDLHLSFLTYDEARSILQNFGPMFKDWPQELIDEITKRKWKVWNEMPEMACMQPEAASELHKHESRGYKVLRFPHTETATFSSYKIYAVNPEEERQISKFLLNAEPTILYLLRKHVLENGDDQVCINIIAFVNFMETNNNNKVISVPLDACEHTAITRQAPRTEISSFINRCISSIGYTEIGDHLQHSPEDEYQEMTHILLNICACPTCLNTAPSI